MKNLRITFGYMRKTRFSNFTYWLCKTFPFIPTFDIDFQKVGRVQYSTYFGIFHWYWRIYKINGKWRFEDLSDK